MSAIVASESFGVRAERGGKAGVIGGAMMVEVVGAERDAREAVQQVIFFVGGVVRADQADGDSRRASLHLLQAARHFFERVFPARRLELAVAAHQRLANALGIAREIEAEAALDAQEIRR